MSSSVIMKVSTLAMGSLTVLESGYTEMESLSSLTALVISEMVNLGPHPLSQVSPC